MLPSPASLSDMYRILYPTYTCFTPTIVYLQLVHFLPLLHINRVGPPSSFCALVSTPAFPLCVARPYPLLHAQYVSATSSCPLSPLCLSPVRSRLRPHRYLIPSLLHRGAHNYPLRNTGLSFLPFHSSFISVFRPYRPTYTSPLLPFRYPFRSAFELTMLTVAHPQHRVAQCSAIVP